MNTPRNTYTIRVGSPRTDPHRIVIRPASRTAFGVAQEFFSDVSPGEHYKDSTYRFMSTTWGWVYVTMRPTEESDYADPQIPEG